MLLSSLKRVLGGTYVVRRVPSKVLLQMDAMDLYRLRHTVNSKSMDDELRELCSRPCLYPHRLVPSYYSQVPSITLRGQVSKIYTNIHSAQFHQIVIYNIVSVARVLCRVVAHTVLYRWTGLVWEGVCRDSSKTATSNGYFKFGERFEHILQWHDVSLTSAGSDIGHC